MGRKPAPTTGELEEIREQLRAEIREARGTLKDLQAAVKVARETAPQLVTEILHEEVKRQLAELQATTARAMDDSVKRVMAKFDELHRLLTGQDHASRRAGTEPLPSAIADYVKRTQR